MRIDEAGKECLAREIDPFCRFCALRNAARIIHEQALSGYEAAMPIEQ
jgi:hypothetical protein